MRKSLRFLLCATASAGAAMAQPVWAQAAASQPNNNDIEDIIVTASRRDESIRKIPVAITAYAGDRLKESQVRSLADLITRSPNIGISTSTTNANVTIRGIGNTQSQAGADAGVAIHVDGVYLGESLLALSTFLDVSRLEVLRGPQGTLFGRNATGGAINLIPNQPTEDLLFGADVSAGVDPSTLQTSAFVSGPLSDGGTLRARVAVQQNYKRGETKNLAPTGPRHFDGFDNYSSRGQLMWVPSDDFSARLSLDYQHENASGRAIYLLGTPNPAQILPAIIRGLPTGDPDKDTIYANVGRRKIESGTALLNTIWQLGGGELKGIFSYNKSYQFVLQDGDGTAAPHSTVRNINRAHQYYNELTYGSDASKPFNFVIGAAYYRQYLSQDVIVPISVIPTAVHLGGVIRTNSYAGFAHAQYQMLDRLKLFGGARYTHDRKTSDDFNNFIGAKSQEKSWSKFTYEGGLNYEFGPHLNGYAKYATGYKSGGFAAGTLNAAFNPETNQSMEAGLKGSLADGRLQANLALFHMKYKNLQVNQVIGVSGAVTNAARATIDGLETEFVARPTPDWRLELSGSWLNARFDEFFTVDSARPALGLLDLSGNKLPLAPKFAASLGSYYDLRLAHDDILTLGARLDWKAHYYFQSFNLPITEQPGAAKLDLSVRYRSSDERWTASVYALNVTDKRTKTFVNVVSALIGSLALGQYGPGRQLGVSVGYRY